MTEEPIYKKIEQAVKQLKNGKAAGLDKITAELIN